MVDERMLKYLQGHADDDGCVDIQNRDLIPLLADLRGVHQLKLTFELMPADLERLCSYPSLNSLRSLSFGCINIDSPKLELVTKFKELTTLGLGNVGVKSAEILKAFPKLEAFSVSGGILDEADIETIAGITGLKRLSFVNVGRLGNGIEPLAALTGLIELIFAHSYVPPTNYRLALPGMTALRKLIACYWKVTAWQVGDEFPDYINANELEEICLNYQRIGDAGVAKLARFTKLRKISLLRTNVSDAGLKALCGLPDLTELLTDETRVTPPGRAQFWSTHSPASAM